LYEQSGEVDGTSTLYQLASARIAGGHRAGKVPEFKSLTALDAHGFYDEDKGTNYGQAVIFVTTCSNMDCS